MLEDLKVWINGSFVNWKEANVHLLSHSFSRASAIFDVFGIHKTPKGTALFRADKHLDRFFKSAELLYMNIPYSKEQLLNAAKECIRVNNIEKGIVKIFGYYSEEAIISLVLDTPIDVAIFTIPEFEDPELKKGEPLKICFSSWRKIHPKTVPVEAKACSNYLNGALIRREAIKRGFDVGISLTTEGYVAEGSIESIFIVKNGTLYTPKAGNILLSITRMSVLELADYLNIAHKEKNLLPSDVVQADEVFLSHTGIKVNPVKQVEDVVFNSVPGEITEKLSETFDSIINLKIDKFRSWLEFV